VNYSFKCEKQLSLEKKSHFYSVEITTIKKALQVKSRTDLLSCLYHCGCCNSLRNWTILNFSV